jgi:exodeoxyribonuclease VII small subunit
MAEKKNADFEQSLERLETLVAEMESGSLSLEAMMKHFEEGSKLVEVCSAKLNEVEQKIEKLVKKDGELKEEPFGGFQPGDGAVCLDLCAAARGLYYRGGTRGHSGPYPYVCSGGVEEPESGTAV